MAADKIVLCTGANQGLGFEIIHVTALREPSSTYILACRRVDAAHEAVKKLRDLNVTAKIEILELDVNNDAHIEAAIKYVTDKYGKLDVLINNAGIGPVVRPDGESVSEVRATYNAFLSTNLVSAALISTFFLPLLHAAPTPKVVNITSGLASMTNQLKIKTFRSPSYGSSKVGLNGLTVHMQATENDRVAELEAGKSTKGFIRFYTVQPGVLKTAFTRFNDRTKDPALGAEVITRLAVDEGDYPGGTYWEYEEDTMRQVPW